MKKLFSLFLTLLSKIKIDKKYNPEEILIIEK